MRAFILLCLMALPAHLSAESVVATRTLRAKEIVAADSVKLDPAKVGGAAERLEDVVGYELKSSVYAGRPIMTSNIAKAAVIERNQVVRAIFAVKGLRIEASARALERGAVGDVIEAMNIVSRKTIRAEVTAEGQLKVLP